MRRARGITFFPDDWIAGTMQLSLEEEGAYIRVCALIYSKGGPIPDNERWLAGMCRVSMRKWRTLRDRLAALGKIQVVDGWINNARCQEELEKRAEKSANMSRKSAEFRANSERDISENPDPPPQPIDKPVNGVGNCDPVVVTTKPSQAIEVDEKGSARDPAVDLIDAFDRTRLQAFGENRRRPFRHPQDIVFARRWLAAGVTVAFIEPIFLDYMRQRAAKNRSPPDTLKYLDQFVADAFQTSKEPMPDGRKSASNPRQPAPTAERRSAIFDLYAPDVAAERAAAGWDDGAGDPSGHR